MPPQRTSGFGTFTPILRQLPPPERRSVPPAPEAAPGVERWDWGTFRTSFEWNQGEHVSLIGPTGQGKTTLALALLPIRDHVVVCATKPRDAVMEALAETKGWRRQRWWPPTEGARKVVLWPPYTGPKSTDEQRRVFSQAFGEIFAQGAWCVYIDELAYFSRELKMDDWLRTFWQQGRSMLISLVGSTQRPAWVPLDMFSAATHIFIWRTNDQADLDRISGIGWLDASLVRKVVAGLDRYECLYLNTRDGTMVRTQAPAPAIGSAS